MGSESPDNASGIQDGAPTSEPKKVRKRYEILIGERVQRKLVTADTPELAIEIVYNEWGVERTEPVTAKLKYPTPPLYEEINNSPANSTPMPSEGIAFMLGRTLIGWTTRVAERNMKVRPLQRIHLEQGCAPDDLKAHARRTLEARGAPMERFFEIAAAYVKEHPERASQQRSRKLPNAK